MELKCDACQAIFNEPISIRDIGRGYMQIAFICPNCKTIHHSHFTTKALQKKAKKLNKYSKKANRNATNWNKYQRHKVNYQAQFDRVQEEGLAQLAVFNVETQLAQQQS